MDEGILLTNIDFLFYNYIIISLVSKLIKEIDFYLEEFLL